MSMVLFEAKTTEISNAYGIIRHTMAGKEDSGKSAEYYITQNRHHVP